MMTETGRLIAIDQVSPRDIQQLANRALSHKEAASSSLAVRIGYTPDLLPLRKVLHAMRRTPAAASLRALGEGGWWTQLRKFEAGFSGVSDSTCKVCHDQVGDLYHRCCGCSGLIPLIRGEVGKKHSGILDVALSAVHSGKPLFQHGVPESPYSAPALRRQVVWRC